MVVASPAGHEVVVAAPLDDPAVLHHQDQVRPLDGGKAVGDDQGGTVPQELLEALLDQGLALGVEA